MIEASTRSWARTEEGVSKAPHRQTDLPYALALAVIMAVATQVVIGSFIGFDDSNITMNYAENIAGGHGYVYFVGGERVEGSTSPLWTLINIIPFVVGAPIELWLAGIGFCISTLLAMVTFRMARLAAHAADAEQLDVRWAVALLYLALPGLFGWINWSYMDIGLWILLNALLFLAIAEAASSGQWSLPRLVLLSILLVTCRPEGIGFVAVFAGLILVQMFAARRGSLWIPTAMMTAGLATFGSLAALRLAYFGYPVPNTFYAKVSTNFHDQLSLGLEYTLGYLSDPRTIVLFLLAAGLALSVWRGRRQLAERLTWWFPIAIAGFAKVVYTVLGGDHFGSFRFYQFLAPVLVASGAAMIFLLAQRGAVGIKSALVLIAAVASLSWVDFARTKGGFEMSIAIAKHSRAVGRVLESWDTRPSIAVIPAGGVSVTYSGPIYDLMGLNWIDMAMAGRDAVTEYKNHGGFDRAVFFETLPDIVDPHFGICNEDILRAAHIPGVMLDDLFNDPEFLAIYEFTCRDGLVFYERR